MPQEVPAELDLDSVVADIMGTIEREREREIVARRFGLFDRRETLEQIGELLGITRERVRQLEKVIVTRLKAAAQNDLPHMDRVQVVLGRHLNDLGDVAKVADLTAKIKPASSKTDQS